MTGHHMAGHLEFVVAELYLEFVAELCREGNPNAMATARSMLAHRQMLVALEAVEPILAHYKAECGTCGRELDQVRAAIAEATGDKS